MDSGIQSPQLENTETKATFRKPSNDMANRKYRRHSPMNGSSLSDGSPKRDQSSSPVVQRDDPAKASQRRKGEEKELDRDSGRSRYEKNGESYRHSDRYSSRSSHGYSRNDDYSRHDRRVDDGDRHHQVVSHSGRESKDGDRGRSRDYARNSEKYSRDRHDGSGHRNRDKERELSEHQKLKDKDFSPDRIGSGRKYTSIVSEEKDRDWHRRDKDGRDEKRDYHRSSGDHKSDRSSYYEDTRGYRNDSSGKDRLRESYKSDPKELNGLKEKKKHDNWETSRDKDRYSKAPGEKNDDNPTGGIKKEEMDIPPVITILLVGFSGSGKSSLVNLMYSVLGRSGLIPFAQTSSGSASKYTTMYMEEHNVMRSLQGGFCVYDSRGFSYGKIGDALEELSSWMSDGVHHNQLCLRSGDDVLLEDDAETAGLRPSSKFVQRTVNFSMVVVNIAEVYKAFKASDSKPLEATRELFHSPALRYCNENPILILTHGDLLTTEQRIDIRIRLCERLGISETNGVYDIVCLTEYGFLAEESDPVTAYAVTEAVYRALLISDRGHFPKKNLQDWAVFLFSWSMYLMGALFAFLADLCSKLGRRGKLKH